MSIRARNSRLPILLLSGKSPVRKAGGYAAYSRNLAKLFRELGHPVYIVAQGEKNSVTRTEIGEEHLVSSGFANLVTSLNAPELVSLPILSALFVKEIQEVVRRKKLDQFIVWGVGPWSYAGVRIKAQFRDRVHFISSYPTTFQHELRGSYRAIRVEDYGLATKMKYFLALHSIGKIYGILEHAILRTCDMVVCHYDSSIRLLQEEYPVAVEKIRCTSYYVDVFRRRSAENASQGELADVFRHHKTLLIICRHDPRKGINYLLRAFRIVVNQTRDVKLIIVGSGALFKANRRLAKKLGIENDVIFAGFVADTGPLLRKADIFVLPSIEEGGGSLSILEAMKEGKAIITTRCDGMPEDIQDHRDGLLVPVMDIESLAKAILETIDDPARIKYLGKNARKRYAEKFNRQYMKRDIKQLLWNQ